MQQRWVEVVVEVPRFGFVKRRSDGAVDFVSPVPCPFNYGSIPGTLADDGDPEDVLLLGPRRARGERVRARVVGRVDFLDDGRADPKHVCTTGSFGAFDRHLVDAFFRVYARAKRALGRVRGNTGPTAYRGVTYSEAP